jgi:hypothetical protein
MNRESDAAGIWRDGDLAIVERGVRLPRRCFWCNAAAEQPVKFLLKWAEPEDRGKAFVRDVLEKLREEQILVTAYVCRRHAPLLRVLRRIGPVVMLCGVLVMVVAILFDLLQIFVRAEWLTLGIGAGILLLGTCLRHVRLGQPVATRIDGRQAVVDGFGRAFLDSLPSWADARAQVAADLERLTE